MNPQFIPRSLCSQLSLIVGLPICLGLSGLVYRNVQNLVVSEERTMAGSIHLSSFSSLLCLSLLFRKHFSDSCGVRQTSDLVEAVYSGCGIFVKIY